MIILKLNIVNIYKHTNYIIEISAVCSGLKMLVPLAIYIDIGLYTLSLVSLLVRIQISAV